MMNSEICPIYLKLPTKYIVHLNCYLESYEGLGELRTLDQDNGEVVILAIGDTLSHVRAFIDSVKAELEITEIEKPESVKKDWLLGQQD